MIHITPRERFHAAFLHQEADRVPVFDIPNNPELFKRQFGKANTYSEGVPHVRLSKALGMDACFVPEGGYTAIIRPYWTWTDSQHFLDELGVGYEWNDSSWPLGIPITPSLPDRRAWEKLTLPDPQAEWRHEQIALAVQEAHQGQADDIAVIAGMRSAFSVMYISMGMMEFSLRLYDDPDLILEMSETLCGFWTQSALRAAELGVDAIYIANDMGFNNRTILSPAALRKFFLPALKQQIATIRESGVKVILHSCGNINAILADIVATGVDGLNNLQIGAGMDIAYVKQRYGDRLTLLGNVDATNILPTGTPEEIETAVIETLRIAAPGGGHILATDHSFHQGIPLKNVDIFLTAARKWGVYPLQLPSVDDLCLDPSTPLRP